MKYRKKPVVIEAFQFYVDNMPDWFMDAVSNDEVILYNCDHKRYTIDEVYCRIHTLEGWHWCNGGDYVIKGIKGELYPCKADVFNQTYEEVKQMTKIEELEQKLNECQKALAELKESKKEGKWKPKDGEVYWYRDVDGDIYYDDWSNHIYDKNRCDNTLIFPTKEECTRYWHFMDTVKEKSYEFSKEEWRNYEILKYSIAYNFEEDTFWVTELEVNKYFGEFNFKDKESAQYIIDNFKDELMEFFL